MRLCYTYEWSVITSGNGYLIMIENKRLLTTLTMLMMSLALIGCKKSTEPQPPIKVTAITIKDQSIPVTKDFITTASAESLVNINARVSGFLVQRAFTEGDYVKMNQLLYVIDKRPFQATLDQANATLQQKLAIAIYQEKEYLRMKHLIAKAVISQQQYDSAVAQARSAQADVLAAKAAVETARLNLSYCTMVSPVNGKIGQTLIDVGNYVNGGTTPVKLTTVIVLDPIYFLVNPSDQDYNLIQQYMTLRKGTLDVEVTIPGSTKVYQGVLNFTNNAVDQTTSTVTLRATLPNPTHELLPGLHGTMRVYLTTNPHAILIPQTAVQEIQGKEFAYVIDAENKAQPVSIQTNGLYKNQSIISSGLNIGDRVITNNFQTVRPGRAVIVETTPPTTTKTSTP